MGKEVAILEPQKAPMLLASINPSSNMEPIAAALRTKNEDELTWEYVTTTLIDEHDARKNLHLALTRVTNEIITRNAHIKPVTWKMGRTDIFQKTAL